MREHWEFPASAQALESSWQVLISHRPQSVPAAITEAQADSGRYGTRHVPTGSHEFWIHEDDSGVHVSIGDESAAITMYGEPFSAWLALHGALTEALCASRLIRLHAAAMGKEERTMVLLGPSGRGKSTTLLRGLAAGWQPIAEDGCWLEPGQLRVFGLDRAIRLWPDAVDVLRDVNPGLAPQPGRKGKVEVSFEDVGGRLDDRALTDVVLLERQPGSESTWLPLSNTEAVMTLYAAIGVPHTEPVRAYFARVFGEIVERTDCSRLRLGDTVLPL